MKKLLGHFERTVMGSPQHRANIASLALSKRHALPLFGADGISSVAYAPDEIILMLSIAGSAGLVFSPWVGLGIAIVLLIVIGTYRYNISEIAEEGDYQLVDKWLGRVPAVTAGASTMVDFLLTVAVSVASATTYITAVLPEAHRYSQWIAVGLIFLVALLCLRGLRFMGKLAAIPTYAFLMVMVLLILVGSFQYSFGFLEKAQSASYYVIPRASMDALMGGAGLLILLARAFSSGAVAMTGAGGINHSIKFFSRPKKKNAAATLLLMGSISAALLVGILFLVNQTGAQLVQEPHKYLMVNGVLVGQDFQQKPLLYQLAETIFASKIVPWLLALSTVGILLIATTTAFIGFPVVTSRIAENAYLPVHMSARTSSNLYANAVLVLALSASLLILIFGVDVNSLVQLYIVGVFTNLVLTQSAILRHKVKALRLTLEKYKRRKLIRDYLVTLLGLTATALSLLVVLLTKLSQGAWITLLLIGATVGMMLMIRKHYDTIDAELDLDFSEEGIVEARRLPSRVRALVFAPRVRKPVARALAYARASRASSIEAVTVNVLPEITKQNVQSWEKLGVPVPLTVLDSPYRDPIRPIVEYVRSLKEQGPRDVIVVYLPEYVTAHWWEGIFQRRTVHRLAAALRAEPRVVIASVHWNIGQENTLNLEAKIEKDDRG